MFGHKILLGETDTYEPPPALDGPFTAYCDECGKECSYEPGDVLRFEIELPALFQPRRCLSRPKRSVALRAGY